MVHFHQPSTKVQCIDWAHHDASSTTVTPIIVHLKQVSSGRHEPHEGVLVDGFHGILRGERSSGHDDVWFPKENVVYAQTPSFPLEDGNVTSRSEDVEERISYRRRHWKVWRMWSIMFWVKIVRNHGFDR